MLDADGQSALTVVESLGARGVPVTAGSTAQVSLGGLSKYSDRTYSSPDPSEEPERFVSNLERYLDATDHFAVIPTQDATTALLARHKPRLEETGTLVATEDPETFERAFDKERLADLVAERTSVPQPATFAPESVDAVEDIAPRVSYPAVVKPRSKSAVDGGDRDRDRDRDRVTHHRVSDSSYVAGPDELVARYRETVAESEGLADHLPLVQEYVPGTTTTTVGLADDGELAAHFQEERLRTYPSSGGNSALLKAVESETMLAYAEEVLGALSWTGPAMVEFMRTPDGEYRFIEVNGRYWGSMPFAVNSGVDVPWLHYRQLRGEDVAWEGGYRTDVVQRRLFFEDVQWLGERLGDGDVGALGTFLRSFATSDPTFYRPDDPLPTLWELVEAGRLGVGALLGRR